MDSVREGEGGKIWENGIETCKISCMKQVASPGSMHDAGCLGLVHWDDPEGWNGEGGGRRVQVTDFYHGRATAVYVFDVGITFPAIFSTWTFFISKLFSVDAIKEPLMSEFPGKLE